jgi:N-acetylmuramoyl-L-alanine amidase
MVKSPSILYRYSPNHGTRPSVPVQYVVMHYTGMQSGADALAWLCNPDSKVSAHYCVEEDGRVYCVVEEDRRAWHAGVSYWAGCENVNDVSIGIEVVNPGHEHGYRPFPSAQMEAVRDLTRDILLRHALPASAVVAHSDIAPLRKDDPGELFPWAWLADYGVGIWSEAKEDGEVRLQGDALAEALHGFGYAKPSSAEEMHKTVLAFQRHWRPESLSGVWDAECEARLTDLQRLRGE